MKKHAKAAIVALGLTFGVVAGVPIAHAANITIECETCDCDMNAGTCTCSGCTITIR